MKRRLGLVFLSLLFSAQCFSQKATLLVLSDTINPGTADYIVTGIEKAENNNSPFVVIQLDTPGGLITSTRQIVQAMLNSPLPIVVYISPKGAHAGSAGAIITFASDVAAMAPGTHLGAASPVVPGDKKVDETMQKKMFSDTAAFAESLAKAKGRNSEWARKAVIEAASLIAEDALKKNVIDLMAEDKDDLLEKLKNYTLRKPKKHIASLPKEAQTLNFIEPSVKQKLVAFFANPALAYMIMSLGGLCIWIELTNPGLIFPGIIGGICIILSLISFQLLPIHYGALAFIFLGLALMVAEVFLATYGLVAIAGVVCFIFGSLFLMDTAAPDFQISLYLILPIAGVLIACALAIGYLVVRSARRRVASGTSTLVGEIGQVRETIPPEGTGQIFIHGELWQAASATQSEIELGSTVVVREIHDMVLLVEKSKGEN